MANVKKDPRSAYIGVRLKPINKQSLQALAEQTDRSVSWHIEQAVIAYLTQHLSLPSSLSANPSLSAPDPVHSP